MNSFEETDKRYIKSIINENGEINVGISEEMYDGNESWLWKIPERFESWYVQKMQDVKEKLSIKNNNIDDLNDSINLQFESIKNENETTLRSNVSISNYILTLITFNN